MYVLSDFIDGSLAPEGRFRAHKGRFCRLGSRIGMELEGVLRDIYVVGDGSEWFLVDEEMLMDLTEELDAVLVDPLKTTIVQDYRCMTTWVVREKLG